MHLGSLLNLHNTVISSTFTGSLNGIMEEIELHVSNLDQRRAVGMSTMKVIETAVVVDKNTLDYHGSRTNVVAYVLDIMHLVSTRLYKYLYFFHKDLCFSFLNTCKICYYFIG